MAAVWFRFRAELRTRWRSALGLALLVGLAGGIVLTAIAGARRTDSAYPRFIAESEAFDVLVVPDSLDVETSVVDALVLGLGSIAVIVLVFLMALLAARRLLVPGGIERGERGTALTRLVTRIGLRPSAASGIRFAMEPGRRRTAVHARTTLVTSAVAVGMVLAALTFAAGLDRLVETPRLFGVTWQLEAEGGGEGSRPWPG